MLVNCGGDVSTLRKELLKMKGQFEQMRTKQAKGTYTRWGRSTCPSGATIVYDGFTAGSHYSHSGGAASPICLSKEPKYHFHYKKTKAPTYIYGAEYSTDGSIWDNLHDHEIPCAICQIPRTGIVMIPGRDDCPEYFKLEYRGYLLAGHYTHRSATEYICMDRYSEPSEYSNPVDQDGTLFYFVEAKCGGSLKCLPYKSGKLITCAVCSS